MPHRVCMYVCMYVKNMYVHADNLTAQTVTEVLWECIIVLERKTNFSCTQS